MDYLDRVPNAEPVNKLDAYLTALAAERNRVAELKAKVEAERVTALLNSNFHQLLDELAHAEQNEKTFSDEIRKITLVKHDKGEVLPDCLKVKNFKIALIPNMQKAKEWCMTNFTPAIGLLEATFTKAVLEGLIPQEIAAVKTEKRAQIAQDLSEYAKP